jgi:hypothetical protein
VTDVDLNVRGSDTFDDGGDFTFENIACAEFYRVLLLGFFEWRIIGRPPADKALFLD